MKTLTAARPNTNKVVNFELLSQNEMYVIRGGGEPEPPKTKDIDIYDTRED